MRIIIAADNYYPNVNGSSYFMQRVAADLKMRGHKILVVVPSFTMKQEAGAINGIQYVGLPSFAFKIYRGLRLPLPILSHKVMEKVITDFKPDLVHVQDHFFIGSAMAKAAKKMGIPVIGTNHFMPENLTAIFHPPASWDRAFAKVAWKNFVSIYKNLDVITTPTQRAALLLEKVGLKKDVVVISNGINLSRFNPAKREPELIKKYKLDQRPTLAFVGRLDPEKNLDKIIKALPQALKNADFQFVIIGKGAEQEKLDKLVADLGLEKTVRLLGFVPDEELPGILASCDCFIIAGMAELQSIATMEAMASGLPVIAVDHLALPELVRPGKNGFLFELGDQKQLSKYIAQIMGDKDLRKEMSKNSLELIKKHDIKLVITQYEQLYAKAIKR